MMRLLVVEGANNESYEDARNWFVGLAKDIPGVVKLVTEDLSSATYGETAEDCEPTTETPIENSDQPGFYTWNIYVWHSRGEEFEHKNVVTLYIAPYTLED